jgi:hypothetical protein
VENRQEKPSKKKAMRNVAREREDTMTNWGRGVYLPAD